MVLQTEVAVVGSGPAGLSAACEIARAGGKVMVFDENARPGGQLFKQIHKFFGSSRHGAGVRGMNIGKKLLEECQKEGVEIFLNSVVYGIFPGEELGVLIDGENCRVRAEKILIATGATEKALAFEGWDRPGVMGAGAFQTMMNVNYVLPGKRVVMIGSGNVGLVVAYQILQAGGEVVAIVEGASQINGYRVHADKLKRQGVPFLLSHSVKKVIGEEGVEKVVVAAVDPQFQFLEGTELELEADTVCVAVGLTPSVELFQMAGVQMTNIPGLGGFIPLHNEELQTSNPNIFVAGDAAGIEEASSAMEEGKLGGVCIACKLGKISAEEKDRRTREIEERLRELRMGKHGSARMESSREVVRRYEQWRESEKRAE